MSQQESNWTTNIIEWYSEGAFDVEVAAKLDVPLHEFYRQMNDNAAFGRLVQFGRTLSEAFWVSQAQRNLNNKTFNGTTWMFVMKNKFNWAEKTEQTATDINPNMNADELRERSLIEAKKILATYEPESAKVESWLKERKSDEQEV